MTDDVRKLLTDVRVLVVECDEDLRGHLARVFGRADLDASFARSGEEARRAFETGGFDLVILDLDLPDADGLDLLADVRGTLDIPVIALSAHHSLGSRITGLGAGANDYMVKPFSALELLARVAAILRSCRQTPTTALVVHGDLRIDTVSRRVFLAGEEVDLTRREFDLLATLARHPHRAFSRAKLLEAVWAASPEHLGVATVTEHVRRVRRKLGHDPGQPGPIVTIRGVGYRFEPERQPRD